MYSGNTAVVTYTKVYQSSQGQVDKENHTDVLTNETVIGEYVFLKLLHLHRQSHSAQEISRSWGAVRHGSDGLTPGCVNRPVGLFPKCTVSSILLLSLSLDFNEMERSSHRRQSRSGQSRTKPRSNTAKAQHQRPSSGPSDPAERTHLCGNLFPHNGNPAAKSVRRHLLALECQSRQPPAR